MSNKDSYTQEINTDIFSNISTDVILDIVKNKEKEGLLLNLLKERFTDAVISTSGSLITLSKIDYVFLNFVCHDIEEIVKEHNIKLHYSFNVYFDKAITLLNVDKFLTDYKEEVVKKICDDFISIKDCMKYPTSYDEISDGYKDSFLLSTSGMYIDFSKMLYVIIDLPAKKDIYTSDLLSIVNYITYMIGINLSGETSENNFYKKQRDKYNEIFKSAESYLHHISLHKNISLTVNLKSIDDNDEVYKEYFQYYKNTLIELERIIDCTDKDSVDINFDTDNNLIEIRTDSIKNTVIQNKDNKFLALDIDKITDCVIYNSYINKSEIKNSKLYNCKFVNDCDIDDSNILENCEVLQ